MGGFDEQQLQQLQSLFEPVYRRFDDVDKRFDDVDRQLGGLWETNLREFVRNDFGYSYSKAYDVRSLQQLAKLICRSTGWMSGSEPQNVCEVARQLAEHLLAQSVAETLLRRVYDNLVSQDELTEVGRRLQADAWFHDDKLDTKAIGRSLPLFSDENGRRVNRKLQQLYRCVNIGDIKGKQLQFRNWSHILVTYADTFCLCRASAALVGV